MNRRARSGAALVAVAMLITACAGRSDTSATSSPPPTASSASSSAPSSATAPVATTAATKAPVATAATSTTNTSPGTSASAPPATGDATVDPTVGRPFDVFVPTAYEAATPTPLVILLHGYTATGAVQEAYFKLQPLAEQRDFLYVHPDGTKDRIGNGFWNATDACCNLGGAVVDDSAYITAIIDQVERDYNVDPKRIFLVGHSNGGFMSYRMACDHADKVAAIVSLAGATFADPSACTPSRPVNVLEIHGTSDQTIAYKGGDIRGSAYPGAETTTATWATYNGCDATPVAGTSLDLDSGIEGDESSTSKFARCRPGGSTELWTIAGGGHVPPLAPAFSTDIIDWLFAHPKP
jgi:polyhydroxybutyrate depolymerase